MIHIPFRSVLTLDIENAIFKSYLQNHLLSLFDNVYRVTFDEKVYDKVLQIHSQENETMELDTPVLCQVIYK